MLSDFMDDKYIWLKIVKFQVWFDWNVDSYYLLSLRNKTGLNLKVHKSRICDILETLKSSASNFKSDSQSPEHFFLTEGQNNFGNKILPFFVVFSSSSHLKKIYQWKYEED